LTVYADTVQPQPTNDLANTIKDYVKNNMSIEPDQTVSIDVQTEQLSKLPKCSKPFDVGFAADANKEKISSVQLTCAETTAWNVFVPVSVRVETSVIIAKHLIPAKQAITEDDIDYAKKDVNQLFLGFYKDKQNVIGQEASTIIQAGTVLTSKNLQSPVLVHRGQSIELVVERGAIVVSMRGVAQSDGRMNSVITASNPVSKRVVDAVVVGENKAKVVS
jgi:flagella basal body P-ring formation protein FlgA